MRVLESSLDLKLTILVFLWGDLFGDILGGERLGIQDFCLVIFDIRYLCVSKSVLMDLFSSGLFGLPRLFVS